MLVAFVAPKQSGKTTACNILKEYWGAENVAQVNFKDGLIAELKEKFPDLLSVIKQGLVAENEEYGPFGTYFKVIGKNFFTEEDITDEHLFTIKPPLIRALLQNYGTEVRRGDDPNYWVHQWIRMLRHVDENDHVLSDDVRFHNEADAVRNEMGILIRITRTDLQSTDTHQSETEQASIQCDHEIVLGYGEQDKLKEELIKIVKLYE